MCRGWVSNNSVGVGVRVGVRISVGSIFGIFRNIPSHNTGTTRGPHRTARVAYLILDKNNPR